MQRLDAMDGAFKEARDEERFMQRVKAWNATCKEIDAHLRTIAKVLINAHQFSLDIGSEGGGKNTRPWLEEVGMTIPRFYLQLEEDGSVTATCDGRKISSCGLHEVDYPWVERAVVEWAVSEAERKG